MVYNYDPSKLQEGGGIRYVHNMVEYLLENDTKVVLMGIKLTKKITYKHPNLTFISLLHESGTWWKYFIKLFIKVPFFKIKNSSVIHTHRTYFMLPFILFHRKNSKVCTLHMKPLEFVRIEYPNCLKLVNEMHKMIESFCINKVDVLITVSEDVKRAYVDRYPKIKSKIKVISGSGVNLDRFKPMDKNEVRKIYGFKKEDVIILFAGRLEKIKNVDFLIRSFALVSTEIDIAKLVIVGRGNKQTYLKDKVEELNIKGKVIFLGEVNSNNMPEVYNCADVFALSSYSESVPTVVREALACGIPAVTTNVGDVKNIIMDSSMGIVVDVYDEELFAQALIDMVEIMKDKYDHIRNECRNVALKQFCFENIGDKISEVYLMD